MKKTLIALLSLLTITAFADVYRVKMSSSANTNGVINTAGNAYTLSPYRTVELQSITLYDCIATNATFGASTNTLYRISSDGVITNSLATIVLTSYGFTNTVFNPTIPFAIGDWPLIVGPTTNLSFKAQGLFLSR
jgi:hypothetical protein